MVFVLCYNSAATKQASSVRTGRIAKLVNVTDDGIEQRLRGLIQIGANAFAQTFDSKLAAVPRLDYNNGKLKEGDDVFAVMKATSVSIEKG